MKKIHVSHISSSDLNTLSYVARAERIANAVKDGRLSFVDKLPPRDWRQSDWNYEVDRLQYIMAYSNAESHSPHWIENLRSAAQGRAIVAERLEEEAARKREWAERLKDRAKVLEHYAVVYNSRRYRKDATLYLEEAAELLHEARMYEEEAFSHQDTADYWFAEADMAERDSMLLSRWEEIYDMM